MCCLSKYRTREGEREEKIEKRDREGERVKEREREK